mgnify:CR=1 FL=1
MKEKMKGIWVEDYRSLTPDALEEIIQLDYQLNENLRRIIDLICDGDTLNALTDLRHLRDDNITHRAYASKCQEEILENMQDYARRVKRYE